MVCFAFAMIFLRQLTVVQKRIGVFIQLFSGNLFVNSSIRDFLKRSTDEINDSGSFFNMSQYMRTNLATRRILTFEIGAVLN